MCKKVAIRTHRMAPTRWRGVIGRLDHGFRFESQTRRTNGIRNRHERFLPSQRGAGLQVAGLLLPLMRLLLLLLSLLLRKQELCLIALHGRVIGQSATPMRGRRKERRTATSAFVTLLLGDRSRVSAAPNILRLAGSTPSASSCWRRRAYLGFIK